MQKGDGAPTISREAQIAQTADAIAALVSAPALEAAA